MLHPCDQLLNCFKVSGCINFVLKNCLILAEKKTPYRGVVIGWAGKVRGRDSGNHLAICVFETLEILLLVEVRQYTFLIKVKNNQSTFISVWTSWGSWDNCSTSCCGGQQSRIRTCMSCGQVSMACIGDANQTQICNNSECPGGNIKSFLWNDLPFRPSYMLTSIFYD